MADNNEKFSPDYGYGNNNYDPDIAHPAHPFGEDHPITCPPNTTERKLMARVDLRVIPFLSIMYLLAFLDR